MSFKTEFLLAYAVSLLQPHDPQLSSQGRDGADYVAYVQADVISRGVLDGEKVAGEWLAYFNSDSVWKRARYLSGSWQASRRWLVVRESKQGGRSALGQH